MNSRQLRFALRKHRRWIAVGLAVVLLVGIGGIVVLPASGSDAETRAMLEAEFAGAYPAAAPAGGGLVEMDIEAASTTIDLVDGSKTEVWAYNGTVPGQPVQVHLGDTLRVTLHNELPVATTIHWHGARVPNTMDGVPGVTQDPVAPGGTFTYEFTPPDAGTFWYHSHQDSTEQLGRGMYGSLVVEDDISAEYSQDVVWMVDDWALTDTEQLDLNFNDPNEVTHNGLWGDLITVNGSTHEELRARPGERVRLRLINASIARPYGVRFPDLPAQLIAADGTYLRQPISADGQLLAPGNRIDVDIVMPNTPGTFHIIDDFTSTKVVLGTIVVEGDPVATPDFATPSNPAVPVWAEAKDVDVDIEYVFAFDGVEWSLNGRSFPDVDPFDIEVGRFTKIRFVNRSERLHPMHLHGQFFKVLAVNGEPVDEGHFRDTVMVFRDGVVDVGLVALEEGTWALHCHILEHAGAGMMTMVDVRLPT